jgi:hypothetical protein
MCAHTFENHVGVLFIKRDGIGSTMIQVTLCSCILFGSIIYVKVSIQIMFLDTIVHYELRATVTFFDVFLVDKMLQIHDIMFVFSVLVENVIGLIVKTVL